MSRRFPRSSRNPPNQPAASPRRFASPTPGANSAAKISGLDPLPGTTSYFIGNDPALWRTGIPSFSCVAYRAIYPGVDLVDYGSGRDLEFDFKIAPHADPSQIRLKIAGADSLETSPTGDLQIATAAGEVRRISIAEIYQVIESRREKVEGSYALASNNEISLQLGPYDTNRALIFDPVIQYSTFLGGTTSDSAAGIFVDASGNAYITGETSSTDFPTTSGVLQNSLHGTHRNAFISKLNSTGSVLLYSTFSGAPGRQATAARPSPSIRRATPSSPAQHRLPISPPSTLSRAL